MQSSARRVFVERVRDQTVLEKEWHPLFERIFADPNDRESLAHLTDYLHDPQRVIFHLIRDENRAAIGVELLHMDKAAVPGAVYVSYAGMAESERGRGAYPAAARISDQRMAALGADRFFYEAKDPSCPEKSFGEFPGESREAVIEKTTARLTFWQRRFNCHVVHDRRMPYLRPALDNPREIQDLYVFAFRFTDEKKWAGIFNYDKTAITKEAYRRFYLETAQVQYPGRSESDLRAEFPAIETFLAALDKTPGKWVNLFGHDAAPRDELKPAAAECGLKAPAKKSAAAVRNVLSLYRGGVMKSDSHPT